MLVQCAWAASRRKGGCIQAQFQRLRQGRAAKKAICAVAASILTAIHHMLRDGTVYKDLGADHFNRASPKARARRLAKQTASLGFTGTIAPHSKRKWFLFSGKRDPLYPTTLCRRTAHDFQKKAQ